MATKSYCLLGFKDELIEDPSKANLSFKLNKIGGKPDWCKREEISNPKCTLCERQLALVTQIYAPLDESINHRTLYVFCCTNRSCQCKSGSWCCLRDEVCETALELGNSKAKEKPIQLASVWLDGADDWDEDENMDGENGNSSNNNDSSEKHITNSLDMESLTLDEDVKLPIANSCEAVGSSMSLESDSSAEIEIEPKNDTVISVDAPLNPTVDVRMLLSRPQTEIPDLANPEFTSFFINVIEEYQCSSNEIDERAQELWHAYQQRENCDWESSGSEKPLPVNAGEDYEKSIPSHGDELMHKFINRVKLYPQQVVRYDRGLKPLLLKPVLETMNKCKYCGSKMVFELQLMPYLSQVLSLTECPSLSNPIEFGTVVIFACSKSCWERNSLPRQEYAMIQSEIE